jgi:large subunit ribosomal protein L25
METLELQADVREVTGRKVKQLRREGLVPAVLYGNANMTLLQVNAKILGKILEAGGSHQLVSLKINQRAPHLTLLRDIQRDPVKRNLLHVDFYAVKMDQKITASVPLVLEGEAPAVEEGGVLSQSLNSIDVECLPNDLVNSIVVNVDGLVAINDSITVADLNVPSSIKLLAEPDAMVVKVQPPQVEEELEAIEEEEAAAEPEVVGRASVEEKEEAEEAGEEE